MSNPERQRIPITNISQLEEGMTIVANNNGGTGEILSITPSEENIPASVTVKWHGVPTIQGIRGHDLSQIMAEASILE
ncbi:MAG: hypothetical protein WC846_03180 [Candidatus Gracilibacteria bacterium]|jgi:hypothetical protein